MRNLPLFSSFFPFFFIIPLPRWYKRQKPQNNIDHYRKYNSNGSLPFHLLNINCTAFLPHMKKILLITIAIGIGRLLFTTTKTIPFFRNSLEDSKFNHDGIHHLTMYGNHRVQSSTAALPIWLQEYIIWNQKQRQRNDTQNVGYLIIQCKYGKGPFGGISDRLRALPFQLLLAQRTVLGYTCQIRIFSTSTQGWIRLDLSI